MHHLKRYRGGKISVWLILIFQWKISRLARQPKSAGICLRSQTGTYTAPAVCFLFQMLTLALFVCLFVLETRSCYVALDSLKLTVLLDQANLELIEIHLPCLPSAEVKGDVLLRLVWGVFFTQNYKHIGFLTNYPAKSIQLVLTNSWQCCDT